VADIPLVTVRRLRSIALAGALLCVLAGAPAALAAPAAPTGLAAATPTNTRPSLSWTAPASSTGTVTYDVWRGATKLTATPISVASYIDTSSTLPQGTSTYTVTANDSTGTSVASASTSVVYDTVAPPVPTGLTAVTPTNTKPVLSWVSGGNDATSGFVGYQVLRGTTLLTTTTATTYTDTTLVTSGSQTYTVKAVDAAGNISTASASKAVMYDTVAPSAPVLTAPTATSTSTTLTWTASTDTGGSTLTRYAVFRDGVLIGAPTPATALTYTDTGAMSPGTYVYTVYAYDGAGNSSLASNARSVVYDVTAPTAPTGLAGQTPTSAKPVLLWTAATDTGGSGLQRYDVYRGSTLAGSTTVTSFTDAATTASGTYTYTVRAVDGAGNVGPASASATVVFDVTAPTTPASLTATTPTASAPVITWTASTDALSGIDHYDVYRGGTKINSSPVTGLTYTDTSPINGSQSYLVRAVDGAGNQSAASTAKLIVYDPVAPSAPALSAPAATAVDPALTWTASTDTGGSSLGGYHVYRDGTLIATTSTTSYTDADSAVVPGTYVYLVVAFDNAGNTAASNSRTVIVDTTAPTTPTQVAATTPTNAKPVISWTAASDGSGTDSSGIVRYDVYRGAVLAGSSTTTSYTDAGATANSSLSYTVYAVDAAANRSPASTAVPVVYDTSSPPVPTNVAGTTPTATAPVISWTSGGADNLSGLDYYAVYRGSTLIGQTSALSFTDSALATAGAQSYTVKAVDLAGNQSAATSARAIVFDPIAPGQPGKPAIASPTNDPTLSWAAATDVGGSNIAHYDVYRTPAGGSPSVIGSSTGTTYSDATVPSDGTYSYDVVAVDGAGNQSVHSASTTVAVDITPPSAPTGVTAQATLTASKPSLSWTLSTDGTGSGIVRYDVYRGAVLAGSSTGTTFIDTTVSANGSYAYTVKAVDAAGNQSVASDPITVTWDSTAPPVPINLTAVTPTSAAPALSWQSGGPASDFDHYDLFRGGTLIWSGNATSYTDNQPAPPALSGNLTYTVKAVDALGNSSSASTPKTVVYDIVAPAAVTTLTGATPTLHAALSWTSATDTGGSALAGYIVYRDGSQIAQVATLTFTDSSLSVDGIYAYTVRAVDNAGNVGPSSPTRTIQVDQTPPPAPTGVIAQTPTNHVVLSWPATPDSNGTGSGVSQYRVYRNGSPIALVQSTTFTDTSLAIEGTWVYTVSAIDAAGNEGPQSAGFPVLYDATPPPAPYGLSTAPLTTSQPSLSWSSGGPDALSGFDHYELLRDGVVVASTTQTSITDVTLTANGTHTYAVRAVDAAGNHSASTPVQSTIYDNTPPAIPASLTVPSPSNRPTLSWAASLDVGGANGVSYSIYRDGDPTPIATTTAVVYQDTATLVEGPHVYTVVATDAAGNASAPSLSASVTVDITPPASVDTPIALSPTTRPVLSWAPATDPSGIARYDVYRGTTLVGNSVTTTFTDAAVATDGSYAYTVVAVDNAGNRALASPPVTVVFDHTPPPTPSIPQAATPTGVLPSLTWTSGGPDALSGFDHYVVYRDGVAVGTPITPSFVDADLATLGAHIYTVRAVDVAGNISGQSPPRTVIYDTQPPPTPNDLTVTSPTNAPVLTWTASNDDSTGGSGVVGYHVYRDGTLIATPTAPTFADGSLSISGSHAYWVTAVDAVGNESAASPTRVVAVDLDPPSAPPDLSAQSPTQRPTLNWGAATDTGPGTIAIDHYNVYRDGTLIARTTTTNYVDTKVTSSGQVTYSVRAVDLAGNVGPPSTPLAVVVDVTGPTLQNLTIPRQRTAGEQITFSVAAIDPQGSTVADPVWSFGDGGAKGSTVTHVFATPGVYSVTVSASDSLGNVTSSAPATITVLPRLSEASVAPPTALTLKTLRSRGWRVQGMLTLDAAGTVTVRLSQGGKTLAQQTRNVTDGRTPVYLTVPRGYRRKGTFTLSLKVSGSALQSTKTFRVK
jgi:large repetitive protein